MAVTATAAGLAWKIWTLKKITASNGEDEAVRLTDRPYMDLQQASMSPPPEYMDMNGTQNRGHEAVIHTHINVQNTSMPQSSQLIRATHGRRDEAVRGTTRPTLELQQASMSARQEYMDMNGTQNRGHEDKIRHTYLNFQNISKSPAKLLVKAEQHCPDSGKHEGNAVANWSADDNVLYIEVI